MAWETSPSSVPNEDRIKALQEGAVERAVELSSTTVSSGTSPMAAVIAGTSNCITRSGMPSYCNDGPVTAIRSRQAYNTTSPLIAVLS